MKRYFVKILTFFNLEAVVSEKLDYLKLFILQNCLRVFDNIVVAQNKNVKSIPIIIISFNQLFFLKQLIDFLRQNGYSNIVIIDNNSDYPPLLDYFNEIQDVVTLHLLDKNFGHLVFWKNKEMFERYSKGYYVITDPDIVPNLNCPNDFLKEFKMKLDKNLKITKVGFSLKINDIPDSNINKDKILNWESKFYQNKDDEGDFIAEIDTTFAIYRPRYNYKIKNFFVAVRMKTPYVAKHGGWYVDYRKLTDEQQYYFKCCNSSSSWRIDENGKLKDNLYTSC
ncbi:Glycosyl transferase family 2 [Flavobacterium daejeonense]|nr:Glycosyl transferase family 2 [Flavobacterium daejeonense]